MKYEADEMVTFITFYVLLQINLYVKWNEFLCPVSCIVHYTKY
jgi:hypothetical protein